MKMNQTELTRLLFQMGGWPNVIANALLASFLSAVLWQSQSHGAIIGWLGAFGFILAGRAVLTARHLRHPIERGEPLVPFRLGNLLTGLVWGGAAVLFHPADEAFAQSALLFALLLPAILATLISPLDRVSAIAAGLPPLIAFCLVEIRQDSQHGMLLSILTLLGLALVLASLGRVKGVFMEYVRLRLDSEQASIAAKRRQNRLKVLELLAGGASLQEILDIMLQGVEEEKSDMLCSILILENTGKRLLVGSAPRLPKFYKEVLDGIAISDDMCSFITACFAGERVVIEDLVHHPSCASFAPLARKADLKSGWTVPINDRGRPLGAFAIYYQDSRRPRENEIELVESISDLAASCIARKIQEYEFLKSKENYEEAMRIAKIGGWEWDVAANVMDFSTETYHILGLNPETSRDLSRYFSDVIHPDDKKKVQKALQDALAAGNAFETEYRVALSNGAQKTIRLIARIRRNEEGAAVSMTGTMQDVTERRSYEQKLEHTAFHDPLTGIPNRAMLATIMHQSLARAKRNNELLVVCYLDLDGFKAVNDTFGHSAGDQLLVEVVRRFKFCIRAADPVARLGGDEFVVLLTGVKNPLDIPSALERILRSIAAPFVVGHKQVNISTSIGVSIFPIDNADTDVLLRHADQAMLLAKQSGKNRFHIFDVESDQRAQIQQGLIQEISEGLANGQFELHYQPKVEMKTLAMVGAEALIRWRHPQRGLVGPGEFLRAIENNAELETQLGNWVIANSLQQLAKWRQEGMDLEISINISASHLQSEGFVENLKQHFDRYESLPANRLQIEVLETAALEDIEKVTQIIMECRNIGTGFALDDFGTGYSSLSYLSKLPVDTLKIDQSFVRGMLDEEADMAIIQAIIALAGGFGLRTVAEGIETEAQYRKLLMMGCQVGQGYGIARPMPAQELSKWKAASPWV
jgi:diguanylate cyclase (GGDEF)-like protein/PAS domain S-box-containing protein